MYPLLQHSQWSRTTENRRTCGHGPTCRLHKVEGGDKEREDESIERRQQAYDEGSEGEEQVVDEEAELVDDVGKDDTMQHECQ